MRNYTRKGTNAENFMQISLLLKKIWYLKDSRNGHFAMHYSSFVSKIVTIHINCLTFIKIISIPDEDDFPKRPLVAPLHTLSKSYDVPLVL